MLEENQDLVFNLIPDTEGKYECNRMGQVRNKNTKKLLSFSISTKGYRKTNLWLFGKNVSIAVHRLILKTFKEDVFNVNSVNHIDGNKLNNHIDNLEWCTLEENVEHYKNSIGLFSSKLTKADVLHIYNHRNDYKTQREIAKKYKVSDGTISNIINQKTFKHFVS